MPTYSATNLNGTQKAAILMMLVGEKAASGVLRHLNPAEVQDLGEAMYSVKDVDHHTVNAVLDEFINALGEKSTIGIGANAYIRNVLNDALGQDKAQSVLTRITPKSSERPIEILDWMDEKSIAELISDEHPQIIALVVASLEPSLAADVMNLLPADTHSDLIERIATLTTIQPEALQDLERVIQRKFKDSTTLRASQIGGVKAAANIMNFTKQDMEQKILGDIKKKDKDLMQNLQDNMFVFESLGKSDDRSLQTLLREVEAELLTLALKGADEALREKLLSCMSSRAAANIEDEMDAMGPVRLSEVQTAQKEIIAIARRMSDEGTITLAGRGGEQMV